MRLTERVDESIWWDIARSCPHATFFHTPLWQRLTLTAFPNFENVTIGLAIEDRIRAILPLLQTKSIKGVGDTVQSTFAGCYGDLVADTSLDPEERKFVYRQLRSHGLGQIQITSNPIQRAQEPLEGYEQRQDFTQILNLESSFSEVFANFSKGHRSSYRKGKRMGVEVRLATSLDDYRAYYGAYEDSLARWGDRTTSHYPWKLFESGFQLAQEFPEVIKLWLATVKSQVVAGALVFYWNEHVDWWHGAAYASYFDHYPNNVLQTTIIENAIANGYRYYDFNPSGGQENVARFKGRFGAVKIPITRWLFENQRLRLGRKVKNLLNHDE